MRPLETALSGAILLTFWVLAIPRLHAARWVGGVAALATLAIAVAQILIEGPRWQMVPAYGLAGVFLLVWLLQSVVPMGGTLKQMLTSRFVASVALILGIIAIGLSDALPLALPVFHFPRPTGPYAIGTVTYHWTDTSRREVLSPEHAAPRELMVQVWYPAKKGSSGVHAPYIQDADAVTTALARLHKFPDFTFQELKYVTTDAIESAPIADDQPSFPVIIVLEGITGYRQQNTFQVEELVSHGYIVVGIDQPGAAASVVFPDGRQLSIASLFPQMKPLVDQSLTPAANAPQFNDQTFPDGIIPYFAQDASFTLDELAVLNTADPKGILTGKLDLAHTGMTGMSLGGMVGAEACSKDTRLKACLMMDVAMTADVVQQGLRQPSMWISRPAGDMRLERQKSGGWAEKDIEQTQTTMRTVYNSLPGDGYFVQIPGAFHIDFMDLDLISPLSPLIGFGGPIGTERAHAIVNAYSLAFFDKQLKGDSPALLDGPSAHYPEVIFEKR